ncbi:MAG: hypothetical protein EOO15_15465 [Chitinophagaceae bacterium]|nr:MAG: hypothetical protein EOO15_15465 [Chitinophagaceae bacterium]
MDELWRKAGNEYPLNTGNADWDAVAARLGIPPEPKRKDRRALWLLLLLLIPVLCMRPFPLGLGASDGPTSTSKVPASSKPVPATPSATQPVVQDRSSTVTTGDVPPGNNTTSENNNSNIATVNPGSRTGQVSPGSENTSTATTPMQATPASTRTARSRKRAEHTATSATKMPIAGGARQTEGRRKGKQQSGRTMAVPSQQKTKNAAADVTTGAPPVAGIDATPGPGTIPVLVEPQPKADSVNTIAPLRKDTVPATDTNAAAPGAPKVKPVRTRRFYAGVVAGTGFTTIKRQRSPGPGYDFGIAIGYQASRHFSIEAQLLWSRKKYFSHGKYLKNDLSYLPQYSYVRSVDGDCRRCERPDDLV